MSGDWRGRESFFRRLASRMVALLFGLVLHAQAQPAQAEVDLWQLLAGGGDQVDLPAEGTTGRADVEAAVTLSGPEGGTALTAPEDEAIIVAHAGSDVKMENVTFRKTGQERFAAYVNGGTLRITNCRIEGGFDTAFQVEAGRLELSGCRVAGADGAKVRNGIIAQPGTAVAISGSRLEGAGEIMVYANGAEVSLVDVTISDAAQHALLLRGQGEARIDGLHVSGEAQIMLAAVQGVSVTGSDVVLEGAGGSAVLAQDAADVSLTGLDVRGPFDGGLILQGGGGGTVEGFAVTEAAMPVQVLGVSGPVTLRNGRIESATESINIDVSDSRNVTVEQVRVQGGDFGMRLTGDVAGARVTRSAFSGQARYGVVLQDTAQGDGDAPPAITNTTIVAPGEGLGLFASNADLVEFRGNTLLGTSDRAIYLERSSLIGTADNKLFTAPTEVARTLVLRDLEGDWGRRFVADGPTDPVKGGLLSADGGASLTVAALVEAGGLSRAEKFALADFAGGKAVADPVALETALLAMPDLGERAERAGIRVDLAAPAGQDGWLPDAVEIALTDAAGREHVVRPEDFPLSLLPGTYEIALDGRKAGVVTIAPGTPLTLPELEQPYLVSRNDEGRVLRGAYLHLRGEKVKSRILEGWRPLRVGEWMSHRSYAIARRGADRDLAEAMIEEARTRIPELDEAISNARAADNDVLAGRLYNQRRMYLEILGEFGTAPDIDWLISTLVANDSGYPATDLAARAEARLGRLEGGPLKDLVVSRLKQALDDPVARKAVLAMARLGDTWALDVLAAMRAGMVQGAKPTNAVPWGIETLVLAAPEVALGHMRDYLSRLKEVGERYAAGDEIEWGSLKSKAAWRNAGLAMAYLARHGTEADRALTVLPVPATAGYDGFLPFSADGAELVRTYLGAAPQVRRARINYWTRKYGQWLCPALTLADADRTRELVLNMEHVVAQAVRRQVITDYWEKTPRARNGIDRSIAYAMGLSAAHCRITPEVTELSLSESAASEEERKFENNDYDPRWWVRPVRARRMMSRFADESRSMRLDGLAQYDTDRLMAMLAETNAADTDLARVFEAHHRLLTDAFVSPQWPISFQSERRVFRLRNEGGDGSISLAGHVDIRPIPDGEKLIVAIRHDIRSPDFGGLAAAMRAPDREPFEVDNRRRMFEFVELEQGGVLKEAQFVASTPTGVLLFEVPFDGDLAKSYLRIGMRFVDTRWQLDVSLFDSHLAVDRRRFSREREGVR